MINLWEGGNKGEGYLRFAKPIITDIYSNNWQIHAHLKLFSETFLDSVVNYHIMNNSKQMVNDKYLEYVESMKYRKKKMYFIYDNISNLYSLLHRNIPVSCVRILDDYYYAIVRNLSSEKVIGVPISFIYEKIVNFLSMVYHWVAIDMSITDDGKSIIDLTTISN